MRVTV